MSLLFFLLFFHFELEGWAWAAFTAVASQDSPGVFALFESRRLESRVVCVNGYDRLCYLFSIFVDDFKECDHIVSRAFVSAPLEFDLARF